MCFLTEFCTINLRCSSFVIAILQLLFCVCHIPFTLYFYYDVSHEDQEFLNRSDKAKHWLKGVAEVLLIFGETFLISASVSLLIGVMKQSLNFIRPYLYYGLVYGVLFVVYVVLKWTEYAPVWFLITHAVALAWQITIWIVIQYYYQELDEEEVIFGRRPQVSLSSVV